MIKTILTLFLLSLFSSESNSSEDFPIVYQNAEFSGGKIEFSRDGKSIRFINLTGNGVSCDSSQARCIDYGFLTIIRPCTEGEGIIGKTSFKRSKRIKITVDGVSKEWFSVYQKLESEVEAKFYWSEKGVEAINLFDKGEISLFLPSQGQLLELNGQCKSPKK